MQHITAIYENGLLRPLDPLELREHEVVTLTLERVTESSRDVPTGEPTLFDIFHEAGLIGCIQDAPADLSENPAHLQGFGKSVG